MRSSSNKKLKNRSSMLDFECILLDAVHKLYFFCISTQLLVVSSLRYTQYSKTGEIVPKNIY